MIIRAVEGDSNENIKIIVNECIVGEIVPGNNSNFIIITNGLVKEIDGIEGSSPEDAWAAAMPIIQRGNIKFSSYLQLGQLEKRNRSAKREEI
jgi:hypothetical protein